MANTTGQKFGGRQAGTPNKLTADIRTALKTIIENEIEQLPDLLSQIDNAEKRAHIIIKLLPFIMPKVQSVHMTYDEPLNINFASDTYTSWSDQWLNKDTDD